MKTASAKTVIRLGSGWRRLPFLSLGLAQTGSLFKIEHPLEYGRIESHVNDNAGTALYSCRSIRFNTIRANITESATLQMIRGDVGMMFSSFAVRTAAIREAANVKAGKVVSA